MEVDVHSRCLVTGVVQKLSINIENVNKIWDLKKMLEPMIEVAACDQTVYYKTLLVDDATTLTSLYVKDGESLFVEFPAKCRIEVLTPVLKKMDLFVKTVCNGYAEMLREGQDALDVIHDCYKGVCESFEICCYDLFLPWNDASSVANRTFFAQEQGLDMLTTIYKFCEIHLNDSNKDDVSDAMVQWFNNNQNILEYMCLLTLWNYSEIKQDRVMVLKKIGLDMFIKSLLRDPNEDGNDNNKVHHINEAAVGCLAQYVELSVIQQMVASNSEALDKLIHLSIHSTPVYSQEVAANTVFCCSNHPKAALQLIKNKTHPLVIGEMQSVFTDVENGEDVESSAAVQYFFSLFLANMRTLPEEELLTDEEKCSIDDILRKFLVLHFPSEIGEYEAEHSYVWITLAPFIQLALSKDDAQSQKADQMNGNMVSTAISSVNCSCGVQSCKLSHYPQYNFSSSAKVGLFSLCQLTKPKANQELFRKEKLVDYLVCIGWFAKGCLCEEVNNLTPDLSGFEQLDPPCLQSVAKAYLAKCYGYKVILK